MAWKQLEPTPAHLTYILLSAFLILYALFSAFIRNRLHMSEPPLATLVGIIFGPRGLKIFTPVEWGLGDNFVQEFSRIILYEYTIERRFLLLTTTQRCTVSYRRY